MKKFLFLSPLLLICAFIIISCAPERKSRLNSDSIVVRIEPPIANVPLDTTKTLTAIVRNAKGDIVDLPVTWSIDPSTGIGAFDSVTGKTAEFRAIGNGIVTITALSNGVTGSINVGCGSYHAPDSIVITSAPDGVSNGKSVPITVQLSYGGPVASGGIAVSVDTSTILWDVSGPGSLSASSGQTVTFTANPAPALGQATVKISFGNLSVTKLISVAEVVPTADAVMIYSDNGFGPNLITEPYGYFHWGDWNWYPPGTYPENPDAPVVYPTTSKVDTTAAPSGVPSIDPLSSLKFEYYKGSGLTSPVWPSGNFYGGFSFRYNSAQNLTTMTKLYFYVRGASGGEDLIVQNVGNASTNLHINTIKPITTNWQLYSITLSAARTSVTVPVSFFFEAAPDSTVYIDYIYFDVE
ncbi:MAG: hypothetical protein FWD54_00840 [Endomicrobia bacterium]|nr:hypothetical protein [Endomicrobiia bacterium]MCL2798819.1 hypothetical protein [Endomicrobiia bacterium]